MRVFPLPVGAEDQVESRRAMAGQPSIWGRVGASKTRLEPRTNRRMKQRKRVRRANARSFSHLIVGKIWAMLAKDSSTRIREFRNGMEELERERAKAQVRDVRDPEALRQLESLRLARTELERQLTATGTSGGALRSARRWPKSIGAWPKPARCSKPDADPRHGQRPRLTPISSSIRRTSAE